MYIITGHKSFRSATICTGVLLIWILVWQGPTALVVGAGGGGLDMFLSCHFSLFFSLFLGDGPIKTEIPSQRAAKPNTTNQYNLHGPRCFLQELPGHVHFCMGAYGEYSSRLCNFGGFKLVANLRETKEAKCNLFSLLIFSMFSLR